MTHPVAPAYKVDKMDGSPIIGSQDILLLTTLPDQVPVFRDNPPLMI